MRRDRERRGSWAQPGTSGCAGRGRVRAAIAAIPLALLCVAGARAEGAVPPPPPPPAGGPVFAFSTRGFGHGVGMSQYGALGAARAGLGAPAILGFYYPGTQIASIPTRSVRVLLAGPRPTLQVSSAGAASVSDEAAPYSAPVALSPGVAYQALATAGGVQLQGPGGPLLTSARSLLLSAAGSGTISLAGHGYRGAVRLLPRAGGVEAVNLVDLETYLDGVVPREVPASWAPAALQAQAVAARTYAVANADGAGDFDLYADTRSQVYGGADAEDPRTTAAVDATRGEVLTYQGQVARTYYSSSSGGRTESAADAFGGPDIPYLESQPDPYDQAASPFAAWSAPVSLSGVDLASRLGLDAPVTAFRVLSRDAGARVREVEVTTASGTTTTLTGAQVRTGLGLRSSWFRVSVMGGAPKVRPVLGPWARRPPRVPAGYRLVHTGPRNARWHGGWIAVPGTTQATRRAVRRTLGPWSRRPRHVPAGYRLVHTARTSRRWHGGWIAVPRTARATELTRARRILGPWVSRPRHAPAGHRLVRTGPRNARWHGGWIAVPRG